MDKQHDNTLRDIGARAASLVSTCDGGTTFQAELLELANDVNALADKIEPDGQILDAFDLTWELSNRIRWARSVVGLIVSDEHTESAITDAADAADAHLREAREVLEKLGQYRVENKPPKPRDLSLGMERHREEHELLQRMLALPHDNQRKVMFCLTSLSVMPPEIRAEAMTLIEKDKSLSDVLSFMALRKDGDISLNPTAEGGAA